MIKKIINKVKLNMKGKNKLKIIGRTLMVSAMLLSISAPVFAAADTSTMDNFIQLMADWIKKIGLFVAFIGGVQTGLAVKNDDADAKTRGIKTCAAGFIVSGICQSLDIFGLK